MSTFPVTGYNDTLFHYAFPSGQAGPYTPTTDDILVMDSEYTFTPGIANMSLTDKGCIYSDNAWNSFYLLSPAPAKTRTIRQYEVCGRIEATSQDGGNRLVFNYVDGSNYWDLRVFWYQPANFHQVHVDMWRQLAGVWTQIGSSISHDIFLDPPLDWQLILRDGGDTLRWAIITHGNNMYTIGMGSAGQYYTVADRPLKSSNDCFIAPATVINAGQVKSLKITDVTE